MHSSKASVRSCRRERGRCIGVDDGPLGLRTEGPMGELMIFLAGWCADMESRRKSECVRAAHARPSAANREGGIEERPERPTLTPMEHRPQP
jgi:hypothetical protein